jgi:DNA sulfur modification protein DndC
MKEEFDTRTISMFDALELAGPSVEELTAKARLAIRQVFEGHSPLIVAYSGGKDSSCCANLALVEAAQCAAMGLKVLVIVTTGSTRVENPEIEAHYRVELLKMRAYAKAKGFRLRAEIVEPSLLMTFQLKILTGRGLPSYAGTSTDCTVDLKLQAQRAARKRIFRELREAGMNEAVTIVGTRFDESQKRAMKMKARGDRADVPVRNGDGELVLCPVAMWSTEDVWEYIGYVSSGVWEGFSDMKEVMRIYAHSAGTSCAVVADSIYEGGKKNMKGGCGTRTGCWTCLQSEDKSLQNMVDFDPMYAYAKPLLRANAFLRNTRYDWSKRHWVGRTIKEGWIAIEPDTFHPSVVRMLTRAFLQMDHDERVRASIARERPKFEIMPMDMIIAVDAIQNLNGLSRPFQIWADLRDIENGIRYDIPDVEPVPPQPMPETRFIHVGNDWDAAFGRPVQGLRSSYLEALSELSPCLPGLRELDDGHWVWDIMTGKGFSVDLEAAWDIEQFEKSNLLKKFDSWSGIPGGITAGYMYYSTIGVLNLDHSQVVFHDEVARRTAWKDKFGLTIDYSTEELYARASRFADMPEPARKAWAQKATDSSSQTDFLSVLDESVDAIELLAG